MSDSTSERPIPEKLYFKIGEVAALVGVQPHVLRYWEREVPLIRPGKTVSRQRRYRRRDVEIFRQIRRLLQEERYTLAGAKRRILSRGDDEAAQEERGAASASRLPPHPAAGTAVPARADPRLARVRAGLHELIRLAGEEP